MPRSKAAKAKPKIKKMSKPSTDTNTAAAATAATAATTTTTTTSSRVLRGSMQEVLEPPEDEEISGGEIDCSSPVASVGSASSSVPLPPKAVHRVPMGSAPSTIIWPNINATGGERISAAAAAAKEVKDKEVKDTVKSSIPDKEEKVNEVDLTSKPEPEAKEVRGDVDFQEQSTAVGEVSNTGIPTSSAAVEAANNTDTTNETRNDSLSCDLAAAPEHAQFKNEEEKETLAKIMAGKRNFDEEEDEKAYIEAPSSGLAALPPLALVPPLEANTSSTNNTHDSRINHDNTSHADAFILEPDKNNSKTNTEKKNIMDTKSSTISAKAVVDFVKDAAALAKVALADDDDSDDSDDSECSSSSDDHDVVQLNAPSGALHAGVEVEEHRTTPRITVPGDDNDDDDNNEHDLNQGIEFLNHQDEPSMPGEATPERQHTPTRDRQIPSSKALSTFSLNAHMATPINANYCDFEQQAQLTPLNMRDTGSIIYENDLCETPASPVLENRQSARNLLAVDERKDGGSHSSGMAVDNNENGGGGGNHQKEHLHDNTCYIGDNVSVAEIREASSHIPAQPAQHKKLSNCSGKAKNGKSMKNIKMPPMSSGISKASAKNSKHRAASSLAEEASPKSLDRPEISLAKPASILHVANPGPSVETKISEKNFRVVSSPAHSTRTEMTVSEKNKIATSTHSTPETQKEASKQQEEFKSLTTGILPGVEKKSTLSAGSANGNRRRKTPSLLDAASKDDGSSSLASVPLATTKRSAAPGKAVRTPKLSGLVKEIGKTRSPSKRASVGSKQRKHKRLLPAGKKSVLSDSSSVEAPGNLEPVVAKVTSQPVSNAPCADSKPIKSAADDTLAKPGIIRDASWTVVSDRTFGGKGEKERSVTVATGSLSSDKNDPIPSALSKGRSREGASGQPKQLKVSPSMESSTNDSVDGNKDTLAMPTTEVTSKKGNPVLNAFDAEDSSTDTDTDTDEESSEHCLTACASATPSIQSAQFTMVASNCKGAASLMVTGTHGTELTANDLQTADLPTGIDQDSTEVASFKPDDVDLQRMEDNLTLELPSSPCSSIEEAEKGRRQTVNPLLNFYPATDPDGPVEATETLQLVDVYEPQPDIFPYAYYARLLGFDVPLLNSDKPDDIYADFHCKTPLPEDTTIHAIPKLGKLYSIWRAQERRLPNEPLIRDDDSDPPLYRTFLKEGWADGDCLEQCEPSLAFRSITSSQRLGGDIIAHCVKQAYDYKLLEAGSWKFDYCPPGDENFWSIKACKTSESCSQRDFNLQYSLQRYTTTSLSEIVVTILGNAFPVGDLLKIGGDAVLQTVLLLLYALALEHGRACGANYFLAEADRPISDILQSRFRMEKVPGDPDDVNSVSSRTIRLACDMNKCSTKYALLQQLETRRTEKISVQQVERERLLVAIPDAVRPTRTSVNNTQESSDGDDSKYCGTVGKKARKGFRRLNVKHASSSELSDLKMRFLAQEGQHEDITEATSHEFADWQILKSFPLSTNENPDQNLNQPEDVISDELMRLQDDLRVQESALRPKLCSLMDSVTEKRWQFERDAGKREESSKILNEYDQKCLDRGDVGRTWKQSENDMDCVCHICNDGEVRPENRIVFCELCEISVHQNCYGITNVPYGHYYCRSCEYHIKEKVSATNSDTATMVKAPPRDCQLCPRPNGAFKRFDCSTEESRGDVLWVHVACAKWQHLALSEGDTYEEPEVPIIQHHECCLCESSRGAFSKCHERGCQNHMHVTCARDSGKCSVVDSATVLNTRDKLASEIFCPEHSDVWIPPFELVSKEQLVEDARHFPSESTPFPRLSGAEQFEALSQPEYEKDFFRELKAIFPETRCDVCDADYGNIVIRCSNCKAGLCECCPDPCESQYANKESFLCAPCSHAVSSPSTEGVCEIPQCTACNSKGGWMRRAVATPKKSREMHWKKNPIDFSKTLFATNLFCHTICSRTLLKIEDRGCTSGSVNFSQPPLLNNGVEFRLRLRPCSLCGRNGGMKKKCSGCKISGHFFHPSCARLAGFAVVPKKGVKYGNDLSVGCIEHSSTECNLRARIETMIVEEAHRVEMSEMDDPSMTFAVAAKFLSMSVQIMRTLGWAWRWEEWWVKKNFRWEPYIPYIKKDETEADYTAEEKRVYESTEASRRADSRDCSLVDFSAALRNRSYDTPDGYYNAALCRALKAILDKESIVGPLKDFEKNFLLEWFARAYRSKEKKLGFGDQKIEIADELLSKCELGDRPLPGSLNAEGVLENLTSESNLNTAPRDNISTASASAQPDSRKPVSESDLKSRDPNLPSKPTRNSKQSQKRRNSMMTDERDDTVDESFPVASPNGIERPAKKRARHKAGQVARKGTPLAKPVQAIAKGAKRNPVENGVSKRNRQSNELDQRSGKRQPQDDNVNGQDVLDCSDDDDVDDVDDDSVDPPSVLTYRSRSRDRKKPGVKFDTTAKSSCAASVAESRANIAKKKMSSRILRTHRSMKKSNPKQLAGFANPPERFVGIKGREIHENDLDDEGDDDEGGEIFPLYGQHIDTSGGRDDISEFTTKTVATYKTARSERSVHFKSTLSEGEKQKLNAALARDGETPFVVTRADREYCRSNIKEKDGRDHPAFCAPWSSTVQTECMLCCRTCTESDDKTMSPKHERKGFKTLWGCPECYLLAFEHNYDVKIDRANLPEALAGRAAYFCTHPRSDDPPCYNLWHGEGPLPENYCETGRSANRASKRQRNTTK